MYSTETISTGRGIAWLALAFSVVALLFAVSAYGVTRSKAGEVDVVQTTAPQTQNAVTTPESTRTKVRGALEVVRANLGADNYEAALVQLQTVREDFRGAYGTSDVGRQELGALFDRVETAVKEKSAEALVLLDDLIAKLADGARVDEREGQIRE